MVKKMKQINANYDNMNDTNVPTWVTEVKVTFVHLPPPMG